LDARYTKLQELAALQAARKMASQEGRAPTGGATSSVPTQEQSGSPFTNEVSRRLGMAVRAAAVSGRFDPSDLFDKTEGEELRVSVLSQLSRLCTMPALSQSKWLLTSDVRDEVLSDAKATGISALLEARLPSTDAFGAALRAGISNGSSARISANGRSERLEALAAIQFLRNADLPAPDPASLDAEVARDNFLAEYRPLLSGAFLGRSREWDHLLKFLRAERAGVGRWSAIVLSGLGGAGKSTLIARFLTSIAKKNEATIAVLDFDRPGVDASEIALLTFEMVRQIGYQRPDLEPELAEIREVTRKRRNSLSGDPNSQSSEERELVGSLTNSLAATLRSRGLASKPLLLVLDTMEEVVIGQQLDKLMEWLDNLKLYLEDIELKVVLSGRLNGAYGGDDDLNDLPKLIKSREPDSVLLGELPRHSAGALLRALGVDPKDARILLGEDLVPRRPLELRLLARLMTGKSAPDAKQLISDLRNSGPLAKEMFAGIVYRRVLVRIRNPIVEKLACPGLVLRYIDPDLVKEVLVPVLGLANVDAVAVTEKLGSYVWLASKHQDGSVWHRRDLRRSMLMTMVAEEPDKTSAINEKAREYFGLRRDEASQAEHLYHSLMLVRTPEEVEQFDLDRVKSLARHFAPDVIDLPLVAQVYVRFAQGQSLRSEDVHLLPRRFRDKAIDEAGERLVRSREYGRAAALLVPEDAGHFRSARSTSQDLPRWSVEALFAAMHWRELVEATDRPRTTPRISSVQQLAELLIPRELVEPLPFSAVELEEMLVDKRIISRALSSRDSAYAGSAALGLALVEERSRLGMKAVGLTSELVRAVDRSKMNSGLSARELLLVGLGTVTDPVEVGLGAAHLTLDMQWLQEFESELVERSQYSETDLIYQVRDALNKSLSEEYPSIRRLLATVDAVENVRKDARLRFTF